MEPSQIIQNQIKFLLWLENRRGKTKKVNTLKRHCHVLLTTNITII